MSSLPLSSKDSSVAAAVPGLPGHTLGFIDSPSACEAMVEDLQDAGIAHDSILTFHGPGGLGSFIKLMQNFQWGESAETMLKQSQDELRRGHVIVCVRVQSHEDATIVAEISNQHGGHDVTHFGMWVDARLT